MVDVKMMGQVLHALKGDGFDCEILEENPNVIALAWGNEDYFLEVQEA